MRSTAELVCVDPARINEFWPHAKDKIRCAMETTGLDSFDGIEAEILEGRQLLWLVWDGKNILAAVTTQISKPFHKVCTITACSGYERNRWLHLLGIIEQYAIEEGCSSIRIFGRRGWERVLNGYKARHVILEKDIAQRSAH